MLHDWIDINNINLIELQLNQNPNTILLLQKIFNIVKNFMVTNEECIITSLEIWSKTENFTPAHILGLKISHTASSDTLNWYLLSCNSNAIHILEKNFNKINWHKLSADPNAINILENNIDKIN